MTYQSIFTSVQAPSYPSRIVQSQVAVIQEEYILEQEKLDVLLNGKWVIIEASLETDGNGGKTVGIFDDYELDLKFGAKIVGNIKLKP